MARQKNLKYTNFKLCDSAQSSTELLNIAVLCSSLDLRFISNALSKWDVVVYLIWLQNGSKNVCWQLHQTEFQFSAFLSRRSISSISEYNWT